MNKSLNNYRRIGIKLNKILILVLILISSCKKDRYVLMHEVKIESKEVCRNLGQQGGCAILTNTIYRKRNDKILLNYEGCGSKVRIVVTTGKKTLYDKTELKHTDEIIIK